MVTYTEKRETTAIFRSEPRALQINLVQPTAPVLEIIFMPARLARRARARAREGCDDGDVERQGWPLEDARAALAGSTFFRLPVEI